MTGLPQAKALWARWGLDPVAGLYDGILIRWREGRMLAVERSPKPPADLPASARFESHLLTPGLLNAHAHVDYSFLRGRLAGRAGFVEWLRGLLRATAEELGDCWRDPSRAASPAARQAAADAVEEMISDGITEVWDVSTFGMGRQPLRDSDLRGIAFEECLGGFQPDWRAHWERWRNAHGSALSDSAADKTRWIEGISPHSVYSLHPDLLRAAAAWARERGIPLAIHLAESPEENQLLIEASGPMVQFQEQFGPPDRQAILGKGRSPIARALEAGALGPRTLAIHCNLPQPGDAEALAQSGAAVAYCPCSHAFFGYPPYPLAKMKAAGIRLALGTDSLASNTRLSIRAEARRLLDGPLSPLEVLAAATGALLGDDSPFGGRGRLEPGRRANWALWHLGSELPSDAQQESFVAAWLSEETRCVLSSAWPRP